MSILLTARENSGLAGAVLTRVLGESEGARITLKQMAERGDRQATIVPMRMTEKAKARREAEAGQLSEVMKKLSTPAPKLTPG
jgi:hypothetical protein